MDIKLKGEKMNNEEKIKKLAEIVEGLLDRIFCTIATKPKFYTDSIKILREINNTPDLPKLILTPPQYRPTAKSSEDLIMEGYKEVGKKMFNLDGSREMSCEECDPECNLARFTEQCQKKYAKTIDEQPREARR